MPPELTNTIEHFNGVCFFAMKHISPTFMYIIPMYFRLTTFTKTLPQMSFHLSFFAIFISLWGSTHDSVDYWSAHRSPAARDSFKPRQLQTCVRLVQCGVASAGCPPNKNPGYASERKQKEDVVISALKMEVSGHQNIGKQQLGWNGSVQKGTKRQE